MLRFVVSVVSSTRPSPDLFAGGTDKRIKVWDTKTYDTIHSFAGPNGSVVHGVRHSAR